MKNKKILVIVMIILIIVIIGAIAFFRKNNQENISGKYKSINSDLISTTIEFIPDSKNATEGKYKRYMETKNGKISNVEGTYKQEKKEIVFENNEEIGILGNSRPKTALDMSGKKLSVIEKYLIDEDSKYKGEVPSTEKFNAIISSGDKKYEFKEDGTLTIDDKEETTYSRDENIITYKHILNDGVSEQTINLYVYKGEVYNEVYKKQEE